jgi:glycerol-3-phosphate acyltransferase PlsX
VKIGLDIMGGDYAPEVPVEGAILALKELPNDARLVLIGDKETIVSLLKKHNVSPDMFDIVHTTEVVGMADQPMKAITQKPNSSMSVGFKMLKNKEIDGFASNGNTGAMMVGSLYSVKAIDGVTRPCLVSVVPQINGKTSVLLDVGSNADCRPDVLAQFAILGQIYSRALFNNENPEVGLLNIGEEPEKGNLVAQAAHQLLKDIPQMNFIGNVEGRDLFDGKADVIVCEGFVGNVVLKEAEAFYTLIKKKKISDPYFDTFNYELYGGCPFLGINGAVVTGHGISNKIATKNMILLVKDMLKTGVVEKIKKAFNP